MSIWPVWLVAAMLSTEIPPTDENLPATVPGPGPQLMVSAEVDHQIPRSPPRTNRSSRPAAKPLVAPGPAVMIPPSEVQLAANAPLVSFLVQRAASTPSTNTSVLVAVVEVEPGGATVSPPREFQPPKLLPLTVLDQRALS